jgi:hypothetical protein
MSIMIAMTALLMTMGAGMHGHEARIVPPCHYEVEARAADARHRGASPRGYSAMKTSDLEFIVTAPERCFSDRLELWVTTPGGHVYQALRLALPERENHGRHGDGERRSRDARASVLFPVRGTLITTNGLYGRWKVEPHVDRDKQPCGRAEWFTIRP